MTPHPRRDIRNAIDRLDDFIGDNSWNIDLSAQELETAVEERGRALDEACARYLEARGWIALPVKELEAVLTESVHDLIITKARKDPS